jgi:hypothetical protein
VRLWHATTYRAETTLNYGMERVWALAASKDSNKCVMQCDAPVPVPVPVCMCACVGPVPVDCVSCVCLYDTW